MCSVLFSLSLGVIKLTSYRVCFRVNPFFTLRAVCLVWLKVMLADAYRTVIPTEYNMGGCRLLEMWGGDQQNVLLPGCFLAALLAVFHCVAGPMSPLSLCCWTSAWTLNKSFAVCVCSLWFCDAEQSTVMCNNIQSFAHLFRVYLINKTTTKIKPT